MSKTFISFKDKQLIYNGGQTVSRLAVRSLVLQYRAETYERFQEILNKKRVKFTDHDIDRLGTVMDEITRELVKLVVELNSDKPASVKKTLTGTDILCAIKCHKCFHESQF